MNEVFLPPFDVNITAGESPSVDYYNFFEDIQNAIGLTADQDSLDDLDKRVTALEDDEGDGTKVLGAMSISVQQPNELTGGWTVALVADSQYPGNNKFYGTGGAGAKGFHAVSDALAVSTNLTKTVGTDGVSTFDLADVTLTAGGALKRYGFDDKGRLSESEDAILSDLSDVADTAPQSGQALAWDGTTWAPKTITGGSGGVPYKVPDGTTYTVPDGIQALWTVPIELIGTASLDVSGALVEVN